MTRVEQHLDLQTSLLHLQFYTDITFTELATDDLHGGSQRLKMKMVRLPVKKNPPVSSRISLCVGGSVVGSLAVICLVVMLRKYGYNNDLRDRNGVAVFPSVFSDI